MDVVNASRVHAAGLANAERDHFRGFNFSVNDQFLGQWTVGSVHHDTACAFNWWELKTHRGHRFDDRRNDIVNRMQQPGHTVQLVQWKPQGQMQVECLGNFENLDGFLGMVTIPNAQH